MSSNMYKDFTLYYVHRRSPYMDIRQFVSTVALNEKSSLQSALRKKVIFFSKKRKRDDILVLLWEAWNESLVAIHNLTTKCTVYIIFVYII